MITQRFQGESIERELDALVAKKVFLRETYWYGNDLFFVIREHPQIGWACDRVPNYSTDYAAAWELVEKLHLSIGPSIDNPTGWYCALMGSKIHGTEANTAPFAICRTALKVVSNGS